MQYAFALAVLIALSQTPMVLAGDEWEDDANVTFIDAHGKKFTNEQPHAVQPQLQQPETAPTESHINRVPEQSQPTQPPSLYRRTGANIRSTGGGLLNFLGFGRKETTQAAQVQNFQTPAIAPSNQPYRPQTGFSPSVYASDFGIDDRPIHYNVGAPVEFSKNPSPKRDKSSDK